MYVPPAGQNGVAFLRYSLTLLFPAVTIASPAIFFSASAHCSLAESIMRILLIQAFFCDVERAFTNDGIAIAASKPIKATTMGIATRAIRHPIAHGRPDDFWGGTFVILPQAGHCTLLMILLLLFSYLRVIYKTEIDN